MSMIQKPALNFISTKKKKQKKKKEELYIHNKLNYDVKITF